MLPNVSAEWIDEYKSAYYVLLTEILLSVVNRSDIKEDSRLLLKISDVILLVDNIDEDAIRTKCRVLYQMGQKGLSKQSFDKFCIEYERLLNAKPDFSYDDIINSSSINNFPLLSVGRWRDSSSSVAEPVLIGAGNRSHRYPK